MIHVSTNSVVRPNQSKCYPSAHQCTSISVQSDVIYQNSLIEDVNTWLMRCIPA